MVSSIDMNVGEFCETAVRFLSVVLQILPKCNQIWVYSRQAAFVFSI